MICTTASTTLSLRLDSRVVLKLRLMGWFLELHFLVDMSCWHARSLTVESGAGKGSLLRLSLEGLLSEKVAEILRFELKR